jgi:hypothetical protein
VTAFGAGGINVEFVLLTWKDLLNLQAKIILCVFFKIQCFRLARDSLARIIPEFTAGVLCRYNTTLFTKNLRVIHDGATGAIGAGTGLFLAK